MKKLLNKTMLLAILAALFLAVTAAAAGTIGTGVVTGDALRLRSEPSTSASTITLLSKGSTVQVQEALDGWYKITWNGRDGYVSADFLSYTPAEDGGAEVLPEETTVASASSVSGKTGLVTMDGVNFRSGPSTDDAVITELSKDAQLAVISVADGWCQVTWNGQEGYVSGTYVAVDGIPLKDPRGVITGNYVNVRTGPSTESGILTKVSTGTMVDLVSLSDGWYAVKYNGTDGFISADYVRLYTGSSSAGSAIGDDIVSTALSCLGVPYVYGGASPRGFDCSGFTMYVFSVHGYSLPHSATSQWNTSGTYVEKSDLQPGDLVLFCDPSRSNGKACSHVGIYIGDGQFVHASSGSGKKIQIDSLSSDYYTRYYVGAKRVG